MIHNNGKKNKTSVFIEGKIKLFDNDMYIADIAYKYITLDSNYFGNIFFSDLGLNLYYSSGILTNGLFNNEFIKSNNLEFFLQDFKIKGGDSDTLKHRLKSVKEHSIMQSKELLVIYKGLHFFIN